MSDPTHLSATIVDDLYCEALILANDVRATFDLSEVSGDASDDLVRIALSTEGLKTTTRVMHVLAWLLNHRAHFNGEMSEYQLRRHGRLPPDRASDRRLTRMLELPTQLLIAETESLHARVARIERAWHPDSPPEHTIGDLQKRLARAVGRL